MKKLAINGFGRIGRMVFRQIIEDPNINLVAINDLTDVKTLAHLLKYDSAHGKFTKEVEHDEQNLIVDGHKIKILSERDAQNLPWSDLGIDLVVEASGFYTTKELSTKHLTAGAKKVLISAPAKGGVKTVVYAVNHDLIMPEDKIISAASCTTNCLAPIANVLEQEFGIVKGLMTTVHAYTGDQRLQDAPHRDLRRARAGAYNIVPTTTGAAVAVGLVLPQLAGKLDGIAMRVPVITGSVVDLVVELKQENVTVEAINQAVKKHTSESLGYAFDPIVSSDVIGETHGSIFDSLLTKEIVAEGKKMFKVVMWYDNENSYVSQYVRTLKHMLSL